MKAIMMILAVIASASNSTAAFHGRSSFLQTAKDRYLVGHVTNCRMASSISSCAQFCLKRWPLCRSINYREGKGRPICELNDKGLESADTESSTFVSVHGFIFVQLLNFQRHKSCNEIQKKNPGTKSALYEIHPLLNANPIEVFCELDIEEGGFTFLPRSLTLRPDAQQIVDALFKEKKTVLLKLKNKFDSTESYTLIQPHPHYTDIDFGVLANSYSGYTQPKNEFMKEYIFLGIPPNSFANKKIYQGFRSNGIKLQFKNCDGNPNSYFAFFPNRYHQTRRGHCGTSVYENSGLAVNWRSNAKPDTNGGPKMPNDFFFLTELMFGGCGCYTSSDRWKQFGYNSTAIGLR